MQAKAGLHVEHQGSFDLPFSAQQSLELFSPAGERGWTPGWEPEWIYPADGTWQEGMVFRNRGDGEDTLWMVQTLDRTGLRAEYVRVVAESRIGSVRVHCVQRSDGSTEVKVSYELTAVTDAGAATLLRFDAQAFNDMLTSWRNRILTSVE